MIFLEPHRHRLEHFGEHRAAYRRVLRLPTSLVCIGLHRTRRQNCRMQFAPAEIAATNRARWHCPCGQTTVRRTPLEEVEAPAERPSATSVPRVASDALVDQGFQLRGRKSRTNEWSARMVMFGKLGRFDRLTAADRIEYLKLVSPVATGTRSKPASTIH